MAFIPKTLLRRLYVKGSLKRISEEEFEFKLRNLLATGTIVSPLKPSLDGLTIDSSNIELVLGDTRINANEISPENPLKFKLGTTVTIRVKKTGGLKEGRHNLAIVAKTREYGTIKFDIEEIV